MVESTLLGQAGCDPGDLCEAARGHLEKGRGLEPVEQHLELLWRRWETFYKEAVQPRQDILEEGAGQFHEGLLLTELYLSLQDRPVLEQGLRLLRQGASLLLAGLSRAA